jgi:glycerol-3-phosphate acyltransferase PlsY
MLGSVPFAYLFGRLWGRQDMRKVGSRNVGTTNVFKRVGLLPGALTALGDAGKGMLAVVLGACSPLPGGEYIALLAAMAGHNWPVWLGFNGGGGLATFIGGTLLLADWWVVVLLVAMWGVFYLIDHDHCRSAVVACAFAPAVLGFFEHSWAHFAFGGGAGLIVGVKQFRALMQRRREAVEPKELKQA